MFTGKIFKENEPKQVEKNNIEPFTVIEGGKAKTAGKEPPSDDWLTPLPPNTVFLARNKKQYEVILGEYTVIKHSEFAVQLKLAGNEREPFWVDPARFCNSVDCVDILYRGYEE